MWRSMGVLLCLGMGCGDKEAVDTAIGDSAQPDSTPEPTICEVVLPANTWVITDAQVGGAAGAVAWVCKGGSLDINGPGGVFVVEGGGSIAINASDGRYYARNYSAVALNVSGTEIFHEQMAAITVNAIGTLNLCDEIVVDASAVPQGCE